MKKKSLKVYQIGFTAQAVTKLPKKICNTFIIKIGEGGEPEVDI